MRARHTAPAPARSPSRSAAAAWLCVALLHGLAPAAGSGQEERGESDEPTEGAFEEFDIAPEKVLAAMLAEQLVEAAGLGNLERVRTLLATGAAVDHPYRNSDTALHAAVAGGHEDVVALLLDRGADPNRAARRGRSALAAAFAGDALAIARRLLAADARADVDATTDPRRGSLLGSAIDADRREWVDLLLAHGATLTAAAANSLLSRVLVEERPGRLDRMRLLLDLGAEPSSRPGSGIRPLVHVAVLENALPEMELLLARGAGIEDKDSFLGESTLYLAARTGRLPFVERLLALGADLEARAKDGTTPLFAPLSRRDDAMARHLIAAGARVDVASQEGRTPLMELAAWRSPGGARDADGDEGQLALIGLLVDRGADASAVDARGQSPLSLAAASCNRHAMATLARRGARVETEVWIDMLQEPCAPRWAAVLDELRADLELPLPSLEELSRGPLAPPDPRDDEAQRHTLAEIRQVGMALMAWLTDEVSWLGPSATVRLAASGTGVAGIMVTGVPAVSASQLRQLLVPLYLPEVPEVDGWGFRYEYRMAPQLFGSSPILVIRSPGSDGRFSGERYPEPRLRMGLYPPNQTGRDIVWVDGRFVQAPRLLRSTG